MRFILLILFVQTAAAQITPLTDSTYAVPELLLIDYRGLALAEPALYELIGEYRQLSFQDSVVIEEQRKQIDRMGRQLQDMQLVANGYEQEIEKRKEIAEVYQDEVRRLKWWRRAALAVGVAGLTILVTR